ncbi:TetR/AcrR family transcriptional regulator [Streptomyces huiliensis]|uniref:TetR/AcrR family transcriptional regulator n=1 Tax=Streptomyces huiliensis TaxID=2876027 RepID=UPI001CBBF9E8|nr:TetR/AcrR family transcriptional regulator [Streptomyces huiliensis]MBZ4323303.1 TetR/AcrR family transcriptional regulator [Streptomyces huiliensis]
MTAAHSRGTDGRRTDRRQAILEGAFTVFARKGFDDTGVQEVAAEAGVAKPTVYNHFGDKAALFRQALAAANRAMLDARVAALEPLATPGEDLPATLEAVAYELLLLHGDERSCALRRLLFSEITRFPDALDIVNEDGPHRLVRALADRLARLALAGRLSAPDPDLAAEQLLALLTGPMEARTRMGTRRLDDEELRAVARTAVATFLSAYGTGGPGPHAAPHV